MVDSGLVVVVSIIFSMMVCVLVVLTYVKYEWCDVLFSNFTVSYHHNFIKLSIKVFCDDKVVDLQPIFCVKRC